MKQWRVLTEYGSAPPLGIESVVECKVLDSGVVEWIVEGPDEMEAMSAYCVRILSVEPAEPEEVTTRWGVSNLNSVHVA